MARKTAKQQQQEFCDLLGSKNNVIWDCYDRDEKDCLERKIELAIPYNGKDKKSKDKYDETINKIVESIWTQRKFTGGSVMMTQIFILTVDYDKYRNEKYDAFNSTEYEYHTIFRLKKCIKEHDNLNACMIFVDEYARVYMDWDDFLNSNMLPRAYMIAPKQGIYQTDSWNMVDLVVKETPKCSIKNSFINVADTASVIGGIGSSVILIGGIFTAAVAAPVVGGAAVVGGVCAGYSALRSGTTLADRSNHGQTINPISDSEARNHWIGIAGGIIGVAAGGATKLIGNMAQSGENINTALRTTVNIMNATALGVNGAGVVNGFVGVYIKYNDNEPITTLDVLQLSTSLFLFSHSVYNFQTASTIIRTNQEQTIGGFRQDLSYKQRRMFDKMAKETTRLNGGGIEGRAEIIRSVKNIPDRGSYFRDVFKMNKEFNKNNVRISFGPDGKVVLNNAVNVNPNELRANLKVNSAGKVFANVGEIPKGQIPRAQVDQHINLKQITPPNSNNTLDSVIKLVLKAKFIVDVDYLNNILTQVSNYMTTEAFEVFLNFTNKFYKKYAEQIQHQLKRVIPFENICADVFKILRGIAGEDTDFSTFVMDNLSNPDPVVMTKFVTSILAYYNSKKPTGEMNGNCKICGGKFYTTFQE